MKYKSQLRFIFILMLINYTNTNAQIAVNGKHFTSQIGAACKVFNDGSCMIYTNCLLSFQKQKVNVSYYTKASCTSKERESFYQRNAQRVTKIFNWSAVNNRIYIEGFDDYGALSYSKGKLIGKKNVNDKLENMEFIELMTRK